MWRCCGFVVGLRFLYERVVVTCRFAVDFDFCEFVVRMLHHKWTTDPLSAEFVLITATTLTNGRVACSYLYLSIYPMTNQRIVQCNLCATLEVACERLGSMQMSKNFSVDAIVGRLDNSSDRFVNHPRHIPAVKTCDEYDHHPLSSFILS